MEIPIHQSGIVVAAIFILMALVACALCWVVCVIVDEWEKAEWRRDDLPELDGFLADYAKPMLAKPELLIGIEPIPCPAGLCGCAPGKCKIKGSREYSDALSKLADQAGEWK